MKRKRAQWETIQFTTEFQRILQFFLFETPVAGVSCRGKTFKEIGWSGSSRFRILERLLKETAKIEDDNWIFTEIEKVGQLSLIQKNDTQYMISSHDRGKVQSLIYAIRNALAHGSFTRGNNGWYFFENYYQEKLKARIVIAEGTLLEWIKIIKTNPELFSKKKANKKGVNSAA